MVGDNFNSKYILAISQWGGGERNKEKIQSSHSKNRENECILLGKTGKLGTILLFSGILGHFFKMRAIFRYKIKYFGVDRGMEIWDLWDTLNQIWDRIWDLWEIYAQWQPVSTKEIKLYF